MRNTRTIRNIIVIATMVIGLGLNLYAAIDTFGFWALIGRTSIRESAAIWGNHPVAMAIGFLLIAIGYTLGRDSRR